MDYCLLVALSRDSIRFYYNYANRPDEFISLGDEPVVKPLAVWFNGNDVIVGQEALQQAQSQYNNGTAYYHLFDQMEKPGHFNFNGQEHSYNTLVLFAIKAGLTPFFTKVKYGELGELNQNIGVMPLIIMMENDIPDAAQAFIMGQLDKNGFGNMLQVDPCKNLLRAFESRIKEVGSTVVVISSGGNSLDISFFTDDTLINTIHIPEANIDPRLEILARSIWENSTCYYDYLSYENESEILMQVALSFLISNMQELKGSVRLSNGRTYPYFLSRNQLNYIQNDRGSSIERIIIEQVESIGGSAKTSTLILFNQATRNGYIIDLLRRDFPHTIVVKDKEWEIVQKTVLELAKSKNFVFRDASASVLPTESPKPTEIPSPADNRRKKMLQPEVQTLLSNGNIQQATSLVDAFEKDMHQRNISVFDEEITMLRSLIANHCPPKPEPQQPVEPQVVTPTAGDNKKFKILKAEIKTLIANGNQAQAVKKRDTFLKEMHAKGIVAFDNEVQEMLTQSPNSTAHPASSNKEAQEMPTRSSDTTAYRAASPIEKQAPSPTPRDKRDIIALERTVDTKIALGDFAGARAAIKEFGDAMNQRGIAYFDKDIKMMRDKVAVAKTSKK